MTATIWLRISSIITFLFAAGHTLGGLKYWSPMGDNAVLQAMRSVRFDTMGANRSYFDFYMGFGYSLSVTQVMLAILLWQLAALARTNAPGVRPMIAVIILAVAASSVIAWQFILPVPALFSLVQLASLAVAFVVARRNSASAA
jgi:uncharacterized membrane protein